MRELVLGSYMKTLSDEVTIENSWKNYASERNVRFNEMEYHLPRENGCLLYTSDAADERSSVDLGGRRIIKKKKRNNANRPHIA